MTTGEPRDFRIPPYLPSFPANREQRDGDHPEERLRRTPEQVALTELIARLFEVNAEQKDRIASQSQEIVELRRLAETDPVTSLLNRRAFKLLYEKLGFAGLGQLLLFDLDKFKGVNDKHGHPAGDEALKLVAKNTAEAVQRTLRQTDVVARLGGDEFGILLPDTNESGGIMVAGNVLSAIATSVPEQMSDERGIILPEGFGATISVASIPPDMPYEEAYALVDAPLTAAKDAGIRGEIITQAYMESQQH